MANYLSTTSINKLRQRAERMASLAKHTREKAQEVMETAVEAVETTAAAFTFGLIQARYDDVEFAGVPLDLGLGLGMHLAGFLGVGGKMGTHLHAFGNGALASYATTAGRRAGLAWKQTGKLNP